MTGSGKTGLCIGLIEEARDRRRARDRRSIPRATSATCCSRFPNAAAGDFAPWVDAERGAARPAPTPDQFAAAQAERGAKGLAGWGQDGARIGRLRDAAEFAIYTPGSDAGRPLSVLGSLAAAAATAPTPRRSRRRRRPSRPACWRSLGIEADPLRSREHVLLATILRDAWRAGQALDLRRADRADPGRRRSSGSACSTWSRSSRQSDRFALAMPLNTLLAAPGFDLWLHGEPLDVGRLLLTPEGGRASRSSRSRTSSDAERMFVVTLLLQRRRGVDARRSRARRSLRALLYMDEVFGYLPPVAEPPSKRPLLTLLKQARASGLGVVLATQNPVDLDYKGLSNAGTWLIGRLQTERDKARAARRARGARRRRARPRRDRARRSRPRQAHVPAARRARGRAGDVRDALGDVVPARAAHARSDPRLMAAQSGRAAGACYDEDDRAGAAVPARPLAHGGLPHARPTYRAASCPSAPAARGAPSRYEPVPAGAASMPSPKAAARPRSAS